MAHGVDKYRSRRNRALVRMLFWQDWDPIGVNTLSSVTNEYDRYADKAYVMLMDDGATAKEIADYLYWVSSDHMGLGHRPELKDLANEVAAKLVLLKPRLEAESNDPPS